MYKMNSIVLLMFIWTSLAIHYTYAGPMKRLSRMTREVYPEIEPELDGNQAQVCIVGDVVYGVDETVPAEQPCLKCKCQPPGVQCETIRCSKKPGCKAIHRPNRCCPDYQCECEHNGRIYANGERLETAPGGECKVCYCRGGEVQCAEVSCYIRNDCEGKRDPAKCCPKYDHCPPIDGILSGRNVNNTSDLNLSNLEEEIFENWPITGGPPNNSNNFQDENKIPDTSFIEVTSETKIPKNTEIEIDNLEIDDKPLTRITIHEIIPDVKEIPITAPPRVDPMDLEGGQNNSNDLVTDAEPDSSEILEIFHPPPPVLRVGDKLIFLKKQEMGSNSENSTPSSVITVIGAEYLQRGGMEDSAEEANMTSSTASPENVTNIEELKTSESTHILSLVKRKKSETTTTTEPTTVLPEETSTSFIESTTQTAVNTETTSEMTVESSTELKTVTERNPEYPTIPDVMTTVPDDTSQRFVTEKATEMEVRILPGVLDMRNNKTFPENATNTEWLKNGDVDNLNQTTIIPTTEEATTITARSVESVEESTEDSGELTTAKSTKAAIISTENASVEKLTNAEIEIVDMLAGTEESTVELTTKSPPQLDDSMNKRNENDTKIQDVEIISVGKKMSKSVMAEVLPTPMKLVGKRANKEDDEADAVFKQLNDELFAESTERILSKEEQDKEAEAIFRELLEETSTPQAKAPKNKETEALQRVTDALAALTLRGKQPTSNILSTLSNFFGSLRYYDRK